MTDKKCDFFETECIKVYIKFNGQIKCRVISSDTAGLQET